MKKIWGLILIVFCVFSPAAQAVENFDIKINNSYVLLVDEEPTSFMVSNPNVIDFQTITTLLNDKEQIFIHARKVGRTSFTVKTQNNKYEYSFNVLDNSTTVTKEYPNLIEIDKPQGVQEK